MPKIRPLAVVQALDAGLRAEHRDEAQCALDHYADASIAARDDPSVVAEALIRQAAVYRRLSQWDVAADYARRAHQMADDAGLPGPRADALAAEGNALLGAGRFDAALAVYHRLLRIAIDDRQRGIAMQNIGTIHAQREEPDQARAAFETSRALFRRAGYARGDAIASNNLGRLALECRELEAADALLQRALIGARAVEDTELAALALLNLAQLRVAQGAMTSAALMVAGARTHFVDSENPWREIECLCVLADIAEHEARVTDARACLEQGAELARAIGAGAELHRIERRLAAGPASGG